MYPLAIVLITQNSSVWGDITTGLRECPYRCVADLHPNADREIPLRQVPGSKPDLIIVEMTDEVGRWERVLTTLKEDSPDAALVAVNANPTVEMVIAAQRCGAEEFVQAPIAENVRALYKRMQKRFSSRRRGSAVGILSAKGGSGSTTVACHCAAAVGEYAATQGKRALLMDYDLKQGLVSFLMKAKGEFSVMDAARNLHKLDLSYWNGLTTSEYPGLDLLCAPKEMEAGESLDYRRLQQVVSFARGQYEHTIVDLGSGFGRIAGAVLPELSELYLVATPEIAPLYAAKQILQAVRQTGYPEELISLIANRAGNDVLSRAKEIEKILGTSVSFSLPNDYTALYESYCSGKLLPHSSKLARGIQAMAASLTGMPQPSKSTSFDRLFGKAGRGVLARVNGESWKPA